MHHRLSESGRITQPLQAESPTHPHTIPWIPPLLSLPPWLGVKTLLLLRGRWDGREMAPSSSRPSFHAGNLIKSSPLPLLCPPRLAQRPKPDCTLPGCLPASHSARGCLLIQRPIQPCSFPFLLQRQAVQCEVGRPPQHNCLYQHAN